MIREFRAYDIQNGKYWNRWSNAFLLSLEGIFLEEVPGDDGEIEAIQPDAEGEKRFIFEQWTGRVDKNGVKIFEGDICKAIETPDFFPNDKPAPIVTAITLEYVTPITDSSQGGPDGTTTYSEIEVIGNIHDNPELLEDKPCP